MVVYTQSRYHYPSSNYSNYSGHIPQKLWDPANLLQIGNPDRGGNLTCTSFAPSKGRRCWNPINRGNRSDAWRVIDDLSATDPSGPGAFHLLQELAAYTVCIRDHQDQAHSVARKWERIIRAAYPPNHGSSTSCQKQRVSNLFGSRASAGVKAEGRDAKDRSFAEQPYKEAKAREEAAKREKARKDEAERAAAKNRQDLEELKERMRRLEELEEKFRQAEEAARRAKARKEAEEAAAKKRREQEELTERMRRRAEKLRKDREEQERQRAELEKQKWSEAWARYLKGWEDFEKIPSKKVGKDIPWPSKSGRSEQMSTETIREFFLKAPPHTNDPNQLWKIMRRECLRWHTDHIAKTCPGAEKDMKLVDLFKMVTQAVVEVRQKAGSERASRL